MKTPEHREQPANSFLDRILQHIPEIDQRFPDKGSPYDAFGLVTSHEAYMRMERSLRKLVIDSGNSVLYSEDNKKEFADVAPLTQKNIENELRNMPDTGGIGTLGRKQVPEIEIDKVKIVRAIQKMLPPEFSGSIKNLPVE